MTHVASHFGTKKIQSNNVLSVLHCIAKLFNIVDVLGLAKGTKALFKIRWGFTNRYVHNCFINLLFPPGGHGAAPLGGFNMFHTYQKHSSDL